MYLIKKVGNDVNAQSLIENDVISIENNEKEKVWYVVTEELGLEDRLKIRGLRDNANYTILAVRGFGKVSTFRKVGRVVEDRWIENLDPTDEKSTKTNDTNTEKETAENVEQD